MSGSCSRCGAQGEVDYGADGQAYCTSCVFYANNRQCMRCRMYLSIVELQQYRGQLICPYCIQDARDEQRRAERPAKEPTKDTTHSEAIPYPEVCERCGRDFGTTVYIMNGKRLCISCVREEEGSDYVEGKPGKGGQPITVVPLSELKKRSFLEAFLSDLIEMIRRRKKEKPGVRVPMQVVEAPKDGKRPPEKEMPIRMHGNPVQLAKPMNETPMKKSTYVSPIELEKHFSQTAKPVSGSKPIIPEKNSYQHSIEFETPRKRIPTRVSETIEFEDPNKGKKKETKPEPKKDSKFEPKKDSKSDSKSDK